MATKQRTYMVGRRFEVYVEQPVKALSFAHAVEQAEQMQPSDFFEYGDEVEIISEEIKSGTSVREELE